MTYNDFYSRWEETYTTVGITKLCEGLKGSAITSIKCAATPQCECLHLCQRPLTHLNSDAHSLVQNNLDEDAKQAIKDAAGSSLAVKF